MGQWLTSKVLIGDDDGLLLEINRLRSDLTLDARGEAELFQLSATLELYYYLNTGRPQAALPRVDAIAQGLRQHEGKLPPSTQLGLFYNLALVHWLSGQTSMALKWVHRILQFENGAVRKDIRDFAPLLEKVLHFELGNIGLLESWFRSVQYRQRKRALEATLEGLLVDLIHTLLRNGEKSSQALAFQAFEVALDALSEVPGISKFGIQELKAWSKGRC